MEIIRSLVRPIITLTLVMIWALMLFRGMNTPAELTMLVWGTVVWWFGDRTYFKLKNNGK